ncbi:cellulose biosynthesis protein BcsS [Rhodoligotrophos defluvii]|uniref:cellulose biosynthesis protein BcsS n=1 Tax=Rhodoligotrophos defluvii TaxID=2561934 RepID=UPI0010C99E82|nr:cellulose biosynthesis protein BcsS [Rhodoligotrophos defluvii]
MGVPPAQRVARSFVSSLWLTGLFSSICLGLLMVAKTTAGEYYSLSGAGASDTGIFAYQGLIALPMGTFDDTGPIIRVWAKTFAFKYRTDLIDPNVVLPPIKDVVINSQAYAVEVESGYQLAFGQGRLAGFVGASYRHYTMSPKDPGSDLAGDHYDLKLALDGAIGAPTGGWGVGFNGSYVTGVEEYWAQLRPRYRWPSGMEIGLDLAGFGGRGYDYGRAGLFVGGFDLTEWGAEATYLSGEVGGQIDIGLDDPSAYGAVHVGVRF